MKWVYVVLVGVLAIGFAYFLSTDEPQDLNPFPQALSEEPDALLTGFEITQFDTQGIRLYRIYASNATYFENQGRTDIRGLRMTVYSEGKDDWQLTANEGIYEESMEDPLLILNGNVHLSSMGDQQSPITFQTDSLKIYPRRQFAESMSRVIVENESSKFHADQFQADLATKVVNFSARADSQVELLLQTDS